MTASVVGTGRAKSNGSIGTSTKIFYPRSIEEIKNGVDIPKPKLLSTASTQTVSNEISDDDLPF